MHVENVKGLSWGKELTNHAQTLDCWPVHREAIVSSHVERPTLVILSFPGHAGNCSLPATTDTGNEEEKTAQVLHFPASKTVDASVKPANLVAE